VSAALDPLDQLLRGEARLWRGREQARGVVGLPTGFTALDAALPGGGWPRGALSEVLAERPGIGELSLLLPALAQLTREGHAVALISPPRRPCVAALLAADLRLPQLYLIDASAEDAWWAAELLLREGGCAAVLLWPQRVDERRLRRLQLAAEDADGWAIISGDLRAARHSSPAALRLALSAADGDLAIELRKCRGGQRQPVLLRGGLPANLPHLH